MSYSFLNPRDPSIDVNNRPMPDRIARLEPLLQEETEESGNEASASGSTEDIPLGIGAAEKADVFLRLMKHPNVRDEAQRNLYEVSMTGLKVVCQRSDATGKSKDPVTQLFSFTRVFEKFNNQRDIYHLAVKKHIDKEEHGTILTYGTSGSGKTYTLLGTNENPGVIPRAIEHIFTRYENKIAIHPSIKYVNSNFVILSDGKSKREEKLTEKIILSSPSNGNYNYEDMLQVIQKEETFLAEEESSDELVFIWLSFLEIYNEKIQDLLTSVDSELKVISNKGKPYVKGLTHLYVKNSQEAFKVLNYGLSRIRYESTAVNSTSSRSHSIFTMNVIKFTKPNNYTCICYRFGDLAGSERLRKTENVGDRLREAQNINTSLMVLGKCLSVLHENRKKKQKNIVPLRESKLTMLLQAALLGQENLIMIVNMNPTEEFHEENLHALEFASIAREIVHEVQSPVKVNKARFSLCMAQMMSPGSQEVFLDENYRLKMENEKLNDDIVTLTAENEYLQRENDNLQEANDQLLEKLRNVLSNQTEKEMRIRRNLTEITDDLLNKQKVLSERKLEIEMGKIKLEHDREIKKLQRKIEDLEEELGYEEDDSGSGTDAESGSTVIEIDD